MAPDILTQSNEPIPIETAVELLKSQLLFGAVLRAQLSRLDEVFFQPFDARIEGSCTNLTTQLEFIGNSVGTSVFLIKNDGKFGVACVKLNDSKTPIWTKADTRDIISSRNIYLGLVMFDGEEYAHPIYFDPDHPNGKYWGYVKIINKATNKRFFDEVVHPMEFDLHFGTPPINRSYIVSPKESPSLRSDEF